MQRRPGAHPRRATAAGPPRERRPAVSPREFWEILKIIGRFLHWLFIGDGP
jgi:hypothetical protein